MENFFSTNREIDRRIEKSASSFRKRILDVGYFRALSCKNKNFNYRGRSTNLLSASSKYSNLNSDYKIPKKI